MRAKPAFVGYMLRAAIELAKLEGAYEPSPQSQVNRPAASECRVQNAECRVETKDEPPRPTISDISNAMREARRYTPSEAVLSARGAALAFAHLPTFRDEHATGLRADGFSELAILDIAARRHLKSEKNCYRAVAEAHAPPGDQKGVDRLLDSLVNLDITAAKVDALAWNDVLGSAPPEKDRQLGDPQLQEQVARRRLSYMKTLLAWDDADLDLTDESHDAVLNRYRPETGRFDWQLDTGRLDLASLLVQAWELDDDDTDADDDTEADDDTDDDTDADDDTGVSQPVDPPS